MKELFSGIQDAATPINSSGVPTQPYNNASGEFNLKNKYGPRKVKSRKDLGQPSKEGDEPMRDGTDPKYGEGPMETGGTQTDDANDRYFGSFSIQSHRNVMDLLKTHPQFAKKGNVNMGRVENNTRDKDIMPNDSTRTVENGGYMIYENQPQASQPKY